MLKWFKRQNNSDANAEQSKRSAAQDEARRISAALYQLDRDPILTSHQIRNISAIAISAKRRQIEKKRVPVSRVGNILKPIFSLGLTTTSAACVALGMYLIFGGSNGTIVAQATTEAPFTLRERRSALGMSWYEEKQIEKGETVIFHEGDMIYASQPVTLSFTSSDASVVQPKTEAVMLSRGLGLEVRFGRVDHVIVQKVEQSNAVSVLERRAQYPAKFGDNQPPELILEDPNRGSGKASLIGKTEPGAVLMINNTAVKLDNEGRFAHATTLSPDNRVQVISRDLAGNETRLTHILN
jgi:hypothetical protein